MIKVVLDWIEFLQLFRGEERELMESNPLQYSSVIGTLVEKESDDQTVAVDFGSFGKKIVYRRLCRFILDTTVN